MYASQLDFELTTRLMASPWSVWRLLGESTNRSCSCGSATGTSRNMPAEWRSSALSMEMRERRATISSKALAAWVRELRLPHTLDVGRECAGMILQLRVESRRGRLRAQSIALSAPAGSAQFERVVVLSQQLLVLLRAHRRWCNPSSAHETWAEIEV